MYIDHDNKIVFIHIPRTGGTSIKSALNLHDKIYKEDVYHMSANDIPKECEDYFKFTFVRNPFDRFVSLYFYNKSESYKEKFPNKSSMEMSVPGMGTLMSQKFNGEDGYIEQMGQKIPYEDDQKNTEKEKLGLFEEAYLDPSNMEIVSLSPIDGKDVYKIKVKDDSFRFYDAETGLLVMTEETTSAMGNEIITVTKFSDYKEVDGIKFAFKTEIVTGPQTIVIEADQVIVNEEIDDDFFN